MSIGKSGIAAFLAFVKSTPRAANVFALGALFLWVLKALYLDFLPQLFLGAFELGRIVEGILSAIIAGWVFYLFFALLPEAKQKSHIAPFILRNVAMIAGDAKAVLEEISNAAGDCLSFRQVTQQDLEATFAKIPFASHASMLVDLNGTRATWLQFFRYRRDRTQQRIAAIKEQARYVEPELIAILLKIGQNSFFTMAESMEQYPFTNTNLSVLASVFHRYLVECRDVARWHDSHLIPPEVAILPDFG